MFPQLQSYTGIALLFMRVIVAIVFGASGINDLKDPEGRGQSIGASKNFTVLLGVAEVAGALGVGFGVLTQPAAAGLILLMLGAIQRKIFVWHTGFWGKHGTDGWHYDLMLVAMNLVILVTNGGRYVLWK
jgi:putative oxidoreductase